MRRTVFFCTMLMLALSAWAQVPQRDERRDMPIYNYDNYDQPEWNRPEERRRQQSPAYFDSDNVTRLSVGWQRLSLRCKDEPRLTSNLGCFASLTTTYPFYGAGEPFSLGFDATWVELNYVNYKLNIHHDGIVDKETYHQMAAGVQAGVSATFAPSDVFSVLLYARYAPCFDMLNRDGKLYGGYGGYLVTGLSFCFGRIGLGGDFRYGSSDYSKLSSSSSNTATKTADFPGTTTIGFRAHVTVNL